MVNGEIEQHIRMHINTGLAFDDKILLPSEPGAPIRADLEKLARDGCLAEEQTIE